MIRRLLIAFGVLAVAAVVVVGLDQAGDGEAPARPARFDLAAARERLAGAPASRAARHEQANPLRGGGEDAFAERLDALAGHPVVINKWASWCGPCRAEFPAFQQVATERGKEIAFLGVNSGDKRPAAERFLAERPIPFPSYEDPGEEIARAIKAPANYPMTVFLDAEGRTAFIHAGGYSNAAELNADIDRYLGA